jgi:hypothetical protein
MPDSGPVEIKVNLDGSFADAQTRLELTSGKDGDLYFLDDLSPGTAGVVATAAHGLCLGSGRKETQGDVTVKYVPVVGRRYAGTGSKR